MTEEIFGYDLDSVLIAESPPVPKKGYAYLREDRKRLFMDELRSHYRAAQRGYNPPQKKFHVITSCRGENFKPFIRVWLGGHFLGRTLSLTFLEADRSQQSIAEFKAATITRYAVTDYCDGSPGMLKFLDLKLPNHVHLWLYSKEIRIMVPFHRIHNHRDTDGPEF